MVRQEGRAREVQLSVLRDDHAVPAPFDVIGFAGRQPSAAQPQSEHYASEGIELSVSTVAVMSAPAR